MRQHRTEQEMLDEMASRLRQVRTAHGYRSAAAFARFLALPAVTLQKAERGRLKRMRRIMMLALALMEKLKISSDWLLLGDPRFAPDLEKLSAATA